MASDWNVQKHKPWKQLSLFLLFEVLVIFCAKFGLWMGQDTYLLSCARIVQILMHHDTFSWLLHYYYYTVAACGAPSCHTTSYFHPTFVDHRTSLRLLTVDHSVTFPWCALSVLSFSAQLMSQRMQTRIFPKLHRYTHSTFSSHALFSFSPCSRHDLTTFLPPPKRITASASPAVPLLMPLFAASTS